MTSDARTVQDLLALLPPRGSNHLMAIDLAGFTRRAWHGHVNASRDEPERAGPTALRSLARVLRARQPTHLIVAGEGQNLFRKKTFPAYKAGRPPRPDALVEMERAVTTAFAMAGVAPWCVGGLEADDVLHAAALRGRSMGLPIVVVTHDKDADQLVDDAARVTVWDGDDGVKDEAAVLAKWGMAPTRLPEVLALAGDRGDGIPGVDGWGIKKAVELLAHAGERHLDVLLKDGGHWWVPEKWRTKFVANRDVILQSLDLVTLRGEWLAAKPQFEASRVDTLRVAMWLANEAERIAP